MGESTCAISARASWWSQVSGSGGRDEWRTEAVDSDLITLKEWENQKQCVVGGAENLLLGIINVYL